MHDQEKSRYMDIQEFSPVRVPCDVEPSSKRFDTVESPWSAIVDGVRRDEIWYCPSAMTRHRQARANRSAHNRSLGLLIRLNGTSSNLAQLHSTTASPDSCIISSSHGAIGFFAFGLHVSSPCRSPIFFSTELSPQRKVRTSRRYP